MIRFELFALFTWLVVLFTFIANYTRASRQAGKGRCDTADSKFSLPGWVCTGS